MEKVPTFVTDRLVLREFVERDVAAFKFYRNNYDIMRNMSVEHNHWPIPESDMDRPSFLYDTVLPNQGNNSWMWSITLREAPQDFIGMLYLWRVGIPENRGFWLGRPYWGRGYMTEAVAPINDFAFGELGFEKLIFNNAKGNTRSARIKEKRGHVLLTLSLHSLSILI